MINFGAKPANTAGGLNFGAPAMTNTNTTSSGFSFGQPQTSAAPAKSLFGTPAATSTSGGSFSFGTPAATTAQPTTSAGGLNFGAAPFGQPVATATAAPTTSAGGFSFGNPTQAPAPAQAAPTLSGGFSFGTTPASTTSTGFSLGGTTLTPAATTSAPSLGFSLPTAAAPLAATTSSGFSFGLGGTTAPASAGFSFTGGGLKAPSSQAPATSTSVGLGGIGIGLGGAQPPSASADAANAGSKTDGKSTKDQQLPQDLFATIAIFESRRNAENAASEENIRQTAAPFHKVGSKAEEIKKLLAELGSEYLQLHTSVVGLKAEVMKEAEHVEMARRTKETPMALQGENKAPEMFFINLVRSFEAEMIYCRTKIEEVSQCMQAANNPCETPEDISEVLQREHDTLKELAARLYSQHSRIFELSKILKTKAAPNEHAFFRLQSMDDAISPTRAEVRPLGVGGSGLQVFQEQQQRAKAYALGAAPPTMPLANTSTPAIFSGGTNTSSLFSSGGTSFGTSNFNLGSSNTTSPFGVKPLFGNVTSNFGNTSTFGSNTTGVQQSSSPFGITSPFNAKPFGESRRKSQGDDDADGRRKRRL